MTAVVRSGLGSSSAHSNAFDDVPMILAPPHPNERRSSATKTRQSTLVGAFESYEQFWIKKGWTPPLTQALSFPSKDLFRPNATMDALSPCISSSRAATLGMLAITSNQASGTTLPSCSFWSVSEAQEAAILDRGLPANIHEWQKWHSYQPPAELQAPDPKRAKPDNRTDKSKTSRKSAGALSTPLPDRSIVASYVCFNPT